MAASKSRQLRSDSGDRSRVAVGKYGEDVAVQYLQSIGMRILDRNWRSRLGELDIVAMDADTVVAVEVKTRTGDRFGGPLDAVPGRKLARIRQLTGQWLSCHEQDAARVRVDVIGIVRPPGGCASLLHLRGV